MIEQSFLVTVEGPTEVNAEDIQNMVKHFLPLCRVHVVGPDKQILVEEQGPTLIDDIPCTSFPEKCTKWPCCAREDQRPLQSMSGLMVCPHCLWSYGKVNDKKK